MARRFDLHQPGLTVSSSPQPMSAGLLSFVAKTFAAFILDCGGIVSEWLPSLSGSAFWQWSETP